jgi:hypothetical protein
MKMDIVTVETKVRDAIIENDIPIAPMAMIKYIMQLVDVDKTMSGLEKKELVIKVLDHVCAGKDGIMGTDDDLIPESIVDGIGALLRSGVIDEVITLLHTVAVTAMPAPVGIVGRICTQLLRWLAKF